MEDEVISCEIPKYQEQLRAKKRLAVTFVGKDFRATENYMEALGDAYEKGYFGEMEMAVVPVDSQECDKLAEHEGVDVLPTTCVYSQGKRIACVKPTDEDARNLYKETITRLIELSED